MVNITKIYNGIQFDTTGMAGSGNDFAEKFFIPIVAVESISKYTDKVIGKDSIGIDWNMNLDGTNGAYPISTIAGVAVTDIDDLYNKLIALM